MLANAIAVTNGKGGVLKTSLTANLSGLLALAGYRVLVVDLDPQGNLARDLGYAETSDFGASLFNAIGGAPLTPLFAVRPNLDVIPGGDRLEDIASVVVGRQQRQRDDAASLLDEALQPLASHYDLIMIDCPPGERTLQSLALTAARWIVVPTRTDDASLDGLVKVAHGVAQARERSNPDLELLGVVLTGVGASAKRVSARARDALHRDLGSADLLFATSIRYSEAVAQDARRRGQLVHELEESLDAGPTWWQRRKDPALAKIDTISSSAKGLAADYEALALELTSRLAERTNAAAEPGPEAVSA